MRVVLAAIGSRGDVVPIGHLASRFAAAGHDVTVVTHGWYAPLIDPALDLIRVESNPAELLAGPAAAAVRRVDIRGLNRNRHLFADFVSAAQYPTRHALPGADVLVASTFAIAAVDEALRHGVPVVRAHMWPEYAELSGPMPLLPYDWVLPAPLRRLARGGLRRAEPYLGGVDASWQRGRLHLHRHHPVGLTTSSLGSLYAYSPRIVPDRPAHGAVTGWWTPPGTPRLSDEVEATMGAAGEWVFAGFGSMQEGDPRRLVEKLGAACERVGVRAVAQFGDLRGQVHPRVFCIGDEPYGALFPKVRVVIHHGGAGTTGAAVRAGVPTVVVPRFGDHFYWGHQLHALGAAPRPLPRPFVTANALARLIERALGPGPVRRAGSLADQVRTEDGTGAAVAHVEQWVAGQRA